MEKVRSRNYLYEDLCKLDASYKFGDKVGFCKIPLLEEVLEWIEKQSCYLILNLKQ